MRTILVTGFEPFGDQSVNSSWEAVDGLPDYLHGVRILKVRLPVVYFESVRLVVDILKQNTEITDVVLVGEAGGTTRIRVEMIGVNYDDTNMPDNAGITRKDEKPYTSGPDGLFATIPVKELVSHLKESGVPAYTSWSAGQFVCNHTLYGVLHEINEQCRQGATRAGFVHLPYTFEQASVNNTAGLPVRDMSNGLKNILSYLVEHPLEST